MHAVPATTATAGSELVRLYPMAWLYRCADVIHRVIERRRTLKVLAEMDDRMLQDIGLCRSAISLGLPH